MAELVIPPTPVSISMMCAIWATDRQALIDCIRAMGDDSRRKAYPDAAFLLVRFEEGHERVERIYQTEEDIPSESVPCPCGNPKHWLIKYG